MSETPMPNARAHPPQQQALTWDEALRLAMHLHRDGKTAAAESLYRQLLEIQPGDANGQHFLGMLLWQRGGPARRDEARELLAASVRADPGVAAWQNNLGNALLDDGDVDGAAAAYGRCSALDPDNLEVLNNLGCLWRGLGRLADAEAAFGRALQRQPDFVDAHMNLASLLAQSGRLELAFDHFARALELQPSSPRLRRLLAMTYARCGRLDDAARVFRDWLVLEPGNPRALHLLAAVGGGATPERAAPDYVVTEFDAFAGSFDERLSMLDYQAPRLVGEAVAQRLGSASATLDVLDAGAGTGLCARWLRPWARRLSGVDLSAGMLANARQRGGYDELVEADLVDYLQDHPASYDLVVSADTLCYFGRLDDAIAAAARSLRPSGLLVFTVEAHEDDSNFRLQPHGRYSHRRDHVLALLQAAGFDAAQSDGVVLRKEGGQPVRGWLISARRPPATAVS